MKKIPLALFALSLVFAVNAQTRSRIMPSFNGGNASSFGSTGYTINGRGTTDTLAVTDSIAYIYPITGGTTYTGLISFYWTKIGAGTATLTAKLFKCNSVNTTSPISSYCTQVTAGSANGAYSKAFTLSASGTGFIDLQADSCKIGNSRYLKLQFYTSGTASVQGSIAGTVNTSIK